MRLWLETAGEFVAAVVIVAAIMVIAVGMAPT